MTVRPVASTPAVTCSAVDPEPNPLAPAFPVMSDKMPISNHAAKKPQTHDPTLHTPTPKPKQEHAKKLSHRNATEFVPPNKKSPKRTRQEALTLAGQIDELFNARAREAGARRKRRRRWLFMVGGAGAELVAESMTDRPAGMNELEISIHHPLPTASGCMVGREPSIMAQCRHGLTR
uniref:Uncharacterized protein n=1 Tax=Oryza meridionalis TaxID=40149 RepID=A0A0E0BX73_9ORYZ